MVLRITCHLEHVMYRPTTTRDTLDQRYRLLRTGVTQPEHVRSFARAVCSWETVSPGADTNSPVLRRYGTSLRCHVHSLVPSSLYPHLNQFENTSTTAVYVLSLFSTSMIPSAPYQLHQYPGCARNTAPCASPVLTTAVFRHPTQNTFIYVS